MQQVRDLPGLVRLGEPLYRRAGECHLVRFLKGTERAQGGVERAAENGERHGALGGDVHGRDGVGHSRSAADGDHAGLLLDIGPGRGHETGIHLVPAGDHPNPLAASLAEGLNHGSRDDAEQGVDSGSFQLPNEELIS